MSDKSCGDACPPQNLSFATEQDICPPGHLGNGCGICASPMLAADARIMERAPHVTIPYMMKCDVPEGPVSDGRFYPPRDTYTLTNTGFGQAGDNQGIGTGNMDIQPMHMNSLVSDGYPYKNATLRICAWSCMPRGQAFIPARYDVVNKEPVVGCGAKPLGAAGTFERLMIPEPFSTHITPAIVNSLFAGYEQEFMLQDEQTKWWAGLFEWQPSGFGVHNGPTPSNAEPVGGRMVKLPYCLDIPPQQSRKGILSWLYRIVRKDIGQQVWVDPGTVNVGGMPICNADAWNADGTRSPFVMVQYFDFMFYGKRLFLEDMALTARIKEVMCATNCDEVTARNLCCKSLSNGG